MIKLKSQEDIEKLREGGHRLARILKTVSEAVHPGVTTSELDEVAYDLILKGGDKPAFKNYRPEGSDLAYPASLCVSINDEVVHGIPSNRTLKEGDIVALDLGLEHEGMFTDMAISVPVGKVTPELEILLQTTEEALKRGIKQAKVGNRLGDIGHAIESFVRPKGYGLVTELCGHGVGFAPHEEPFVPNFGKSGKGLVLKSGLVIAIEPMVNMGTDDVDLERDGFTFTTADKKPSAHFEHTIVVTEKGPEILTIE